MNRFARFAENAGCQGLFLSAVFAAVVVFLVLVLTEGGDWPFFAGPVVVGFLGSYFLRNLLVGHFRASRWTLNVAVIVAVAAGFYLRKEAPEFIDPMHVTLACGAFMGLYLGCYFWLLSDPRVERAKDRMTDDG